MQHLLCGRTENFLDPITNVASVQPGSVRPPAVSTFNRLPKLPTITDTGFRKFMNLQQPGLSELKGLSALIVQRLAAHTPKILSMPDIAERLEGV